MERFFVLPFVIILSVCGCTPQTSQTCFSMDTVETLPVECDAEVMSGAFGVVLDCEGLLSHIPPQSEVYLLNNAEVLSVFDEILEPIKKLPYYSELTNGAFDTTVWLVGRLFDFKNQVILSRREIAEALKSVDYEHIEAESKQ